MRIILDFDQSEVEDKEKLREVLQLLLDDEAEAPKKPSGPKTTKAATTKKTTKPKETEVSLESVEKLMRSKVKVHKAEIKEKLQELDAANLAAMAEEDYADFYEFLTEL